MVYDCILFNIIAIMSNIEQMSWSQEGFFSNFCAKAWFVGKLPNLKRFMLALDIIHRYSPGGVRLF